MSVHGSENDPETNSKLDHRSLDDLLAHDREIVRRATAQRIAGGMYGRIAQAAREAIPRQTFPWQWKLAAAVLPLLLIAGIWTALSRKSETRVSNATVHSNINSASNHVTNTPPATASVRKPERPRPRKTVIPVRAYHVAQLAPRQAVFPSNTGLSAEERLLLQLAQNHGEELQLIAKNFADDSKQLQEQRRAFEEWLKEGGSL
jgi:hypothetical protein